MATKKTFAEWLKADAEVKKKKKQVEEVHRVEQIQRATGQKVADVVYNKNTGLREVRNYTGGNTARSIENTYKQAEPVIQQRRDLYNYTSGGLRPDKEQIKDTKDWRATRRDDGTEDDYRSKLKNIADRDLTYLEREFKAGRIGLDALEPRSKDANRDRGYLVEIDKSVAKGKKSRTDRNIDKDKFIDRFDAGLSAQDAEEAQSVNYKDLSNAEIQKEIRKLKFSNDSNDQFKHQNLLIEYGRRQEKSGAADVLGKVKGSTKANTTRTAAREAREYEAIAQETAREAEERRAFNTVTPERKSSPILDFVKQGLGIGLTAEQQERQDQQKASFVEQRSREAFDQYAGQALMKHDEAIAKERDRLQKEYLAAGGEMNETAFDKYIAQRGQKLQELEQKRKQDEDAALTQFASSGAKQSFEREYDDSIANEEPEDDSFLATFGRRGVDALKLVPAIAQGAAAGILAPIPGETANDLEKRYRDMYNKEARDNIYLRAMNVAGDAVTAGVIGNVGERITGQQAAYRQDSKRLTGAEELGAGIVGGLSGSLVGYGVASKAVIAGSSRFAAKAIGGQSAEAYAKKLSTGFLEDMIIGAGLDAGFGLLNQVTDQEEGIDMTQLAAEMTVGALMGGAFRGALEVPGIHARHLEKKRLEQQVRTEQAAQQAELERQRFDSAADRATVQQLQYEELLARADQEWRKDALKADYSSKIEQVKAESAGRLAEAGNDPELPMTVNRKSFNARLIRRLDETVSTKDFSAASRSEQMDALYNVFGDLVDRVDKLRSADLDAAGLKVRQQMTHELVQVQQAMDDVLGTDVPLAFKYKAPVGRAEDQFNLRDMYERFPDGNVPPEHLDAYTAAIDFADKMTGYKTTPAPVKVAYLQVAEQMRTNLRDFAEVKAQQDLELEQQQAARLADSLREVGVQKSASYIERVRAEKDQLIMDKKTLAKQGVVPKEDAPVINEWFASLPPEERLRIETDLDIKYNKDGSISRKQKNHTIDQLSRLYVNSVDQVEEFNNRPPAPMFTPKRAVGQYVFSDLDPDQQLEFGQKVRDEFLAQNRHVQMAGDFVDGQFQAKLDVDGNPIFTEMREVVTEQEQVQQVPTGTEFRVDFVGAEQGKYILRKLVSMDSAERTMLSDSARLDRAHMPVEQLDAEVKSLREQVGQLEKEIAAQGVDLTSPEARELPEVQQLDRMKRTLTIRSEALQTGTARQSLRAELGLANYMLEGKNDLVANLPSDLDALIFNIGEERVMMSKTGDFYDMSKIGQTREKPQAGDDVGAEAVDKLREKDTSNRGTVQSLDDKAAKKQQKADTTMSKINLSIESLDDLQPGKLSLTDLKGNKGAELRRILGTYAESIEIKAAETLQSVREKSAKPMFVKQFGTDFFAEQFGKATDALETARLLKTLSQLTDRQVDQLIDSTTANAIYVENKMQLLKPLLDDPALRLSEDEVETYKAWLDNEGKEIMSLKQIMDGLVNISREQSAAFDRYIQLQNQELKVTRTQVDTAEFITALEREIGIIKTEAGERTNPQGLDLIKRYEVAYNLMETNPEAGRAQVQELNAEMKEKYPNAIERVNERVQQAQRIKEGGYEAKVKELEEIQNDAKFVFDDAFESAVETTTPKELAAALKQWFPVTKLDGRDVRRFPTDTLDKIEDGTFFDEMYDMYGNNEGLTEAIETFVQNIKGEDIGGVYDIEGRFLNVASTINNSKRDFKRGAEAPKELDARIAHVTKLYTEAREAARREQVEVAEWQEIATDQATYQALSQRFKYAVHDPDYRDAMPRAMWAKEGKGTYTLEDVARFIAESPNPDKDVVASLQDGFDPEATIRYLARLDERKHYNRSDIVKESEWVRAVRSALVSEMGIKFPSLEELADADMQTLQKIREGLEGQAIRIQEKFEKNPELRAYKAMKEAGLLEGKEVELVEYVKSIVQKVETKEVAIPFREVSRFLPQKYVEIEAAAADMDATPAELVAALEDYVPLQTALDELDAQIGQRDLDALEGVSNEVDFFGQRSTFRHDLSPEELAEIIDYRRVLESSTLQDRKARVESDTVRIIDEYLAADEKAWVQQAYMNPDNPSSARLAELQKLERQVETAEVKALKQQLREEIDRINADENEARAALKEYGGISPLAKWRATHSNDTSQTAQDMRAIHSALQNDVNGVKQLLPDYTLRVRQYLFSKFARISTWDRSVEAAGHKLTPGSRLLDRFEQLGGRTKARFEQSFSEKFMPILDVTRQFNLSPDDLDKLYKDVANWSNLKWNDEVTMNGTDDPLIRVIPYEVDEQGNVFAPQNADEWYESNVRPWEEQGVPVQEIMEMTRKATDDQLERMYQAGFVDETQYLDMKRKAKFGYIPLIPKNKSVDLAPYREALDPNREYTAADQQALAGAQSPFHTLVAREHALAAREEMNRVAHLLHGHVDKLVKSGYDMSQHVRPYEPGMKADGEWGQVVTVFQKDSEPIKYQLSKDYDMLFGFMHEDMGKVEKVLNQISRLDSSLITSRNPVFGLKSLVRDPMTAIQVSGIESVALDLVPSMIEGFIGTLARKLNKPQIMDRFYESAIGRRMTSEANYQNLNELGAVPTSRYDFFGYKPEENTVDAAIHQANQGLAGKSVRGLDELLKFLSDWSEGSSRLIAGRAEYRRTGDMDDAASAATNMLNFSNAGTYRQGTSLPAKTMRLMQFVNPALQGTYGYGKALKRNPVRTMAASLTILAPLAYEFASRDEWSEEQNRKYALLSNYERANNIFIPVGDDFIKFPMPPGIESYPAMTARLLFDHKQDAVPGQDGKDVAKQSASLLTNSLFPMAEAKIPIIQPLIETAINYSRFYEDEIEVDYNRDQWKKRNEEGMMEGLYDGNSYIAIQLAELTGANSPRKIDYLLQNMPMKDFSGRAVDFADGKLREMAGVEKRVKNYSYRDDSVVTGFTALDDYLFNVGIIDPSRVKSSFYVGDDATVNAGAVYDLYDTVDDKHELGLYPKKEELEAHNAYVAPAREFGKLKDEEKSIMEGAPSKDRLEQIKDSRKAQREFMFNFLQNSNK